MRVILLVLSMIALFSTFANAQVPSNAKRAAAESIISDYNSQNFAGISARLDPESAKQLTPDVLTRFLGAHFNQYGKVTNIGDEQTVDPATSIFPLTFDKGEFNLTIALNQEGKVLGFRLTPVAPKTFEENSVELRLPFEGEWFVYWGGDTVAENYHQDHANQRFAFDFVKVDENGKTFAGDGSKNEDYYAFGEKILAPADGVVTDVVNGVRDNVPGAMNPLMALGNSVVIKHADGEYSVYAHFKQNSIVVKVGQTISKGGLIGLCGNSGNTSEPHLHFQIQKNAFFENEGSKKTFFTELLIGRGDSRLMKQRYSPKKGDIIMNDNKQRPSELVPKNK